MPFGGGTALILQSILILSLPSAIRSGRFATASEPNTSWRRLCAGPCCALGGECVMAEDFGGGAQSILNLLPHAGETALIAAGGELRHVGCLHVSPFLIRSPCILPLQT